ncbi:uncharacterized protein LOC109835254 [Asparagus officinalis]|uniref:uncharacterized protein LOC109835254 n=1 Tax=Asparagus officinalis TaxID=4686 RepID=UPI00098E5053|nr:uncharacterized protein LOC109835254 [Asparagus officinalis]
MMKEFEMSDLRLLSYYLGIEVDQRGDCISLRQAAYVKKVLVQFEKMDCNPIQYPMEAKLKFGKDPEGKLVDVTKYRCVIGCLRYITHTRPDISYDVGIMSRYMEQPIVVHR